MKWNHLLWMLLLVPAGLAGQEQPLDLGQLSGNVQVLFQQYNEDTIIDAVVPPEQTGLNAYSNLIYTRGKLSAGVRFEAYLPAIQGYPGRFQGTGLGYRFARYQDDMFDFTVGNFYEQFGTGMLFRAYEERDLGIDNAMDGLRLILRPLPGVRITGIYGRQRLDFNNGLINGDGLIRAIDGEILINETFPSLADKELRVTLGGSFLSKFQPGSDIVKDTLQLDLPENVGSYQARLGLEYKNFQFIGEYVEKINDPNADNQYIYKNGRGAFANLTYSRKGLGINAQWKVIDNMAFRSDRDLLLFDVPINFVPTITKQHTYNLAATLYPYATVLNGESGYALEVFYKIPKGTALGGKYGVDIAANFVAVNDIDRTALTGVDALIDGYETNFFGMGEEKFVRDFNVSVSHKFSKKFKAKYAFFDFEFNTLVTPVTNDFKGTVFADIHVLEMSYKIKPKNTVRAELQALFTEQDKGDWATLLVEYTFSPHWSFSVLDQYNYGNDDPDQRVHYLYGNVAYTSGPNRISVGYGKRREGIFCIGGVCRAVPASNGWEIALATTF